VLSLPTAVARRSGGGAAAVGVPALVAVAAAVAGAAILTAGSAWALPAADNAPVDLSEAVAYPVMGALVVLHGRGSRAVGWVMVAAGAAAGLTVLTTAVACLAPDGTLTGRLAAQAASALWVPGFLPLLTVLLLVFPGGLLPGRRWRLLAIAAVAGIVLLTVATALHPDPIQGRVALPKVVVATPVAVAAAVVAVPLLLVSAAGGLTALVLRWRRSAGLVRRQMTVLLGAAVLLAADVAVQGVLPAPGNVLSEAVAVALLPLAIGVAVTRHRLYDFDLAVRRTLAGASLAVCLAGLYVSVFVLLRAALAGQAVLATGLAAGLTGVVLLPLGTRLAAGVDRLFYGDRADPYRVLAGFSATFRERLDIAEVPQALCDAVVAALRLGSAELVVEGGRRAVAGVPGGTSTEFELRHRGAVVGALTVTPRPGERALDEREAELVSALADSTAPALAALRLTDSLQDARERLVGAREEERRRVRRDLHDGVGAALAGLRLQLDSALEMVAEPLAGKLLAAAAEGLTEAVRDVRQVTDDLRPPVLDDLGLGPSLEALAARVRTPRLAVVVRIGTLPPLPAAVDVACYRIAAEALANAARHSGAACIELTARAEDGTLHLSVADNGAGLTPTPTGRGLGLTSMRQRAEEIGGAWTLDTGCGGTRVSVVLPLATA
jgi:signal transduction histidine kinase